MKFLGMGGFEFVIILIVVLLIFGPKNLPKLGSALGKTVSNLRSGMNEGKKKKDADADNAQEAPGESAPELEGEVQSPSAAEYEPVSDAGAAAEASAGAAADADAEASAGAAADADAEGDAGDPAASAPKTVKRVVKKKASSE